MAAYNYEKRFESKLIDGSKKQTIRARGKRVHASPGGMIQHYVGQRTKYCRKAIEDTQCEAVFSMRMLVRDHKIAWIEVQGKRVAPNELNQFAIRDGFDSISDMHEYWIKKFGSGLFEDLVLVQW